VWNTNKSGGWEKYKASTEDNDESINIFEDAKKSTTDNVKDIEKKMTKKKFVAFGKVKQKSKPENKELKKLYEAKCSKLDAKTSVDEIDDAINVKLLELQREDIEHEIKEVMLRKKSKGKSAAIFHTLQKICGSKKSNQDQVCMKHPQTKLTSMNPMKSRLCPYSIVLTS
jgi:hypothetical protein